MKNLKLLILGMLVAIIGFATPVLGQCIPKVSIGPVAYSVADDSQVFVAHEGDVLYYKVTVGLDVNDCNIINGEPELTLPDGVTTVDLDDGLALTSGSTMLYDLVGQAAYYYTVDLADAVGGYVTALAEIEADSVYDPPNTTPSSATGTYPVLALPLPCIEVTKEVDCDISKEGDEVIYHICIRNCSDPFTELSNVTVVDDELGDLSGLFPDELLDGEWVCIDYPYTIQPDDPDPLVNTVTVSAEDVACCTVTATATDEVDLIHPSMTVTKECQTIPVSPGGDAEFLVTITNTGDADLEISTNDPEIPDFTLPTAAPVFTQIVTETHTGGEEVCNEIQVTWTLNPDQYCGMENTDTITSGDCCPVSQPCVNVEKSVEPEVSKIGDDVLYTIQVCNPCEADLTLVSINDTVMGDLSGSFASDLPAGECETHSFPYTIQPDDPDPLHNVVTVVYEDVTGFDVSDTDYADVNLVEVCIDITKDVEPTVAEVGEEVLYTICIHNCGEWALEHVVVEDPLLGGILPFPDTLAVDEMVCVAFPYVIQPDDPPQVDNCAVVESDPEGPMENPVGDRDCARVTMPLPCVCRLTGGGVDEEYSDDGALDNDRIQFGGQAGANTALPPQPKGEWTHHQQRGPSGRFTFHAGTASAPAGTEIIEIRCSDPGGCKPSGDPPSPAKQVDFDGVGTFKNFGRTGTDSEPTWPDASVAVNAQCSSKGGKFGFDGTFHYFQVNADDLGEPGNKNMANTIECPENGFGEKGDLPLGNCDCADFYRITIYNGVDAADVVWLDDDNIDLSSLNTTDVIYEFHGYLDGGNLQVHYLTGFDRVRRVRPE